MAEARLPAPVQAALALPRARPPALLALTSPAAARLPAAGRGERSGSGRSPNRSMTEAGQRLRQTRSPRAAAGSTPCGGCGAAAAAAREPSITRGRARNATNRRAAWPCRPRGLREGGTGAGRRRASALASLPPRQRAGNPADLLTVRPTAPCSPRAPVLGSSSFLWTWALDSEKAPFRNTSLRSRAAVVSPGDPEDPGFHVGSVPPSLANLRLRSRILLERTLEMHGGEEASLDLSAPIRSRGEEGKTSVHGGDIRELAWHTQLASVFY